MSAVKEKESTELVTVPSKETGIRNNVCKTDNSQTLVNALEEIEALKLANRDLQHWFDDARDEAEKAQAKASLFRRACEDLLDERPLEQAMILHKQSDALIDAHNEMSDSFVLEATGVIQERAILRCQDFLSDCAQRLRQQASELEAGGGDV